MGRNKTKRKSSHVTWDIYNGQIHDLRQEGASLQQIGDEVGRSRERVRQILEEHYGDTEIRGFITTKELAKLAGCPRDVIYKLIKHGLIKTTYSSKKHRLWDLKTVPSVIEVIEKERAHCEVCGKLIKWGKRCKEHRNVKLTCFECGKEFEMLYQDYVNRLKRGYEHFFCGRKCFGKYAGRNFGFRVHPPFGISRLGQNRKYNYEEIYELAKKGVTGIEISERLNIPGGTIYRILRRGDYSHVMEKLKYKELIPVKYKGGKMEKYPYEAKIVQKEVSGKFQGRYDFLDELLERLQEGQAILVKVPTSRESQGIGSAWRARCILKNKVAHTKREKKDDYYLLYLAFEEK